MEVGGVIGQVAEYDDYAKKTDKQYDQQFAAPDQATGGDVFHDEVLLTFQKYSLERARIASGFHGLQVVSPAWNPASL
jgi:hypothetical protein